MRDKTKRGLWPSSIKAEHMGESVRLEFPKFSPDGTKISFTTTFDGFTHLFTIDAGSSDSLSSFRRITDGDGLRSTGLYGGLPYCWGPLSDSFLLCKKDGIRFLQLKTGIEHSLLPFNNWTGGPSISPHNKAVFSLSFKNSMSIHTLDLKASLDDSWSQKVEKKTDFAVDPSWSIDSRSLAWHGWNFPNMAWDESAIHLYDSKNQAFSIVSYPNVSMAQPRWSPFSASSLAFLMDKTGWLNLYLLDDPAGDPIPIHTESADYGWPTWILGLQSYDWLNKNELVSIRNSEAKTSIHRISTDSHESTQLPLTEGYYQYLCAHQSRPLVLTTFSSPSTPPLLQLVNLEDNTAKQLYHSLPVHPKGGLSMSEMQPLHFSFPTSEGEEAYALMWVADFDTIEHAPIIVNAHGGPTSQRLNQWNFPALFFASRGFVFIELNYRGSTGYGRSYTQKLTKNWGNLDTEDAVYLLKHLDKKGYGDTKRSTIMGVSAGGFLVLNTLTKFPDAYTSGISIAGVTDLLHLVRTSHYFESRYSDMLVGSLPEDYSKYYEHSPLHYADQIKSPLLVIQGENDKVVPREQADSLVAEIRKHNVPIEYYLYPKEGHGLQKRKNIIDMYKKITAFLEKYSVYSV